MLNSIVGHKIVSVEEVYNERHNEIQAVRILLDNGRIVTFRANMTYNYTPDTDGRGEMEITISK